MQNSFEIKNIKFYNGNKNFTMEYYNKTLDKTSFVRSTNDVSLKKILEKLENVSKENHGAINIIVITNSFYQNSLDLLSTFKLYPKLFTNSIEIKVCVTTFLIMGWIPNTEIPERVKTAFRDFQNKASEIGYKLTDYNGTKLVTDSRVYLLSEFI